MFKNYLHIALTIKLNTSLHIISIANITVKHCQLYKGHYGSYANSPTIWDVHALTVYNCDVKISWNTHTLPYLLNRDLRSVARVVDDRPLTHKLRPLALDTRWTAVKQAQALNRHLKIQHRNKIG